MRNGVARTRGRLRRRCTASLIDNQISASEEEAPVVKKGLLSLHSLMGHIYK